MGNIGKTALATLTTSFVVCLALVAVSNSASAQWVSDNFNENIELTWKPENPFNRQPVNVIIVARDQQYIPAADLFLKGAEGGWRFKHINEYTPC